MAAALVDLQSMQSDYGRVPSMNGLGLLPQRLYDTSFTDVRSAPGRLGPSPGCIDNSVMTVIIVIVRPRIRPRSSPDQVRGRL